MASLRELLTQLFRSSANPGQGTAGYQPPTGPAPTDPNMPGDPSGPQRFAARAGLMNDTDRAAYEMTQPMPSQAQPTPQQLEQFVAPPPMHRGMGRGPGMGGGAGPAGMPVTEGRNANIDNDTRQRAMLWALRNAQSQGQGQQVDPATFNY